MADWNDIKKAFERDAQKADNALVVNEQTLLKSIANYICSQKGISSVQGYHPNEVIAFLEKPISEIKSCIGTPWSEMADDKLETLIYMLAKKVKKSTNILEW